MEVGLVKIRKKVTVFPVNKWKRKLAVQSGVVYTLRVQKALKKKDF